MEVPRTLYLQRRQKLKKNEKKSLLIVFQIQVNLQVFSQGTQEDSNKKMILNLKRFHKPHTFLNGFIATVINLIS